MKQAVENILLHIDELPLIVVCLFFFASGFLQIALPIYPGDMVLVFGGCLGGLSLALEGIFALLGYLAATIATSICLFLLGRKLGARIFKIGFIQRIVPLERRAQVEEHFRKHGIWVLVLGKFIPGVNSLVILLGGVLQYPKRLGIGAIALSAAVHNLLFFFAGHMLGQNLNDIAFFLREYTLIAGGLAALGVILAAVWFFVKNRKGKQAT